MKMLQHAISGWNFGADSLDTTNVERSGAHAPHQTLISTPATGGQSAGCMWGVQCMRTAGHGSQIPSATCRLRTLRWFVQREYKNFKEYNFIFPRYVCCAIGLDIG